jgi:probable F420-dependent oxidoreductase
VTVLGVNVRNFGPHATPENLLGWARFAEDNGFGIAMISDHIAPTPDVNEIYPTPFYDPFTTIAWLAGATRTLLLGTSVTVLPYRHPLLTARMAANIDRFSGGRFVLGVGVGWSEPEYAALGVPFAKRGRVTDEYLAAVTAAFTDDVVSHAGEFATYRDVHTGPRPERLPVWVGGSAPAAIRRAVRFGAAWHPINATPAWLRDVGVPALRKAAAEQDRPVPALAPRIRARIGTRTQPGEGTVAQVAADIRELVDLGSEYVILDPNPDHPRDEKPLADDWKALAEIADHVR